MRELNPNNTKPNGIDSFVNTEARESVTRARTAALAPTPEPALELPSTPPWTRCQAPRLQTHTPSWMPWASCGPWPTSIDGWYPNRPQRLRSPYFFSNHHSATPHDSLFVTCLFIRHSAFLPQWSVLPHHLANNCSNDSKKQIRGNQCKTLDIGEHGGYNDSK